jgi:hypothetical protein
LDGELITVGLAGLCGWRIIAEVNVRQRDAGLVSALAGMNLVILQPIVEHSDGTAELLDREPGLLRINHPTNGGYGAALISAFRFLLTSDFDILVTMDCDGQHQPERARQRVASLLVAEVKAHRSG